MVKKISMTLVSVIGLLIVTGVLFVKFSPQFGKTPSADDTLRFSKLEHHNGKNFENLIPTSTAGSDSGMMSILKDYIKGNPNKTPKKGEVQTNKVTRADLEGYTGEPRVLWFGHSTFLLQNDGKNFLFDPMFSDVPAPHPWLGTKRYSGDIPITAEELPTIDAVFISHDHYDHLDYESIKNLVSKTDHFYVPLGVSSHLISWGVKQENITEMDWWEETTLDNTQIVFTPSRHFSGRGLTGQNTSLWGAWLLKSDDLSLYFSGDTGYGTHFKEVYDRYGAVDFALLECGQYNQNWAQIHMMPEETVQAAQDLQAKVMMPVHWGAFTLSLHDWYDPAVRVQNAADRVNQAVIIPEIGELFVVNDEPKNRTAWWETYAAQVIGAQ